MPWPAKAQSLIRTQYAATAAAAKAGLSHAVELLEKAAGSDESVAPLLACNSDRAAPSRRVHEAVFAILALESEPLDSRL